MDQTKSLKMGLMIVRLALAAVFLTHGIMKLMNMDGTVAFFATLGVSAFFTYVVAIVEVLAGISMLTGKFTTLFGYLLVIIMLVAIFKVKWAKGFAGGYEFEFTLLMCALGVALSGGSQKPTTT